MPRFTSWPACWPSPPEYSPIARAANAWLFSALSFSSPVCCYSISVDRFFIAGIYLLLGVGIAAFGPTMMSWVAEISPPTHMGRAYGWYTTALFCGLGMGPAAGGALGEWLGLRPVFLVGAALVAVTIGAVQVLASLSIAGFAPAVTFVHFLLAASSLGLSLANAFTSIGALIAETTQPRFRGLAMGGYNSFIYYGLMAGSIGLGPLIEAMGFVSGFLLAGASNLFFVFFFAWSMQGYALDTQKRSES
jgi:MFS family permease